MCRRCLQQSEPPRYSRGVSIALTKGKAISGLPEAYSSIGGLNVAGILPVPFLVFIICAVILGFILARTTFGANIYMLGTNVKAAGYSGIKVRSYTLETFVIGESWQRWEGWL